MTVAEIKLNAMQVLQEENLRDIILRGDVAEVEALLAAGDCDANMTVDRKSLLCVAVSNNLLDFAPGAPSVRSPG